jgi:hypothetical protein
VPPDPRDRILSREEVSRRLTDSPWKCVWCKDYGTASLWRTAHGFYFSVPHECAEGYFQDEIMKDLRLHGRKRNV